MRGTIPKTLQDCALFEQHLLPGVHCPLCGNGRLRNDAGEDRGAVGGPFSTRKGHYNGMENTGCACKLFIQSKSDAAIGGVIVRIPNNLQSMTPNFDQHELCLGVWIETPLQLTDTPQQLCRTCGSFFTSSRCWDGVGRGQESCAAQTAMLQPRILEVGTVA